MVVTVSGRVDGFEDLILINFENLPVLYVLDRATKMSLEHMLTIESAQSFVDLREFILPERLE